jgi:general secretion pathway protein E
MRTLRLPRQDPNVIMISEFRDAKTAAIACRAALVGRLVLSTLHVNRPEEAAVRLRDLGVEGYIVEAVLRGALGQELVSVDGGRALKWAFQAKW